MLDEKFISGELKLQKSVSFRGLHPLDPDQGFALDPLEGPCSATQTPSY